MLVTSIKLYIYRLNFSSLVPSGHETNLGEERKREKYKEPWRTFTKVENFLNHRGEQSNKSRYHSLQGASTAGTLGEQQSHVNSRATEGVSSKQRGPLTDGVESKSAVPQTSHSVKP